MTDIRPGADLRYLDLRGADLREADLSGADLSGADLRDAHLTFADLTRADLTRADLTGANLGGADLTGANLTDVDLTRADSVYTYRAVGGTTFEIDGADGVTVGSVEAGEIGDDGQWIGDDDTVLEAAREAGLVPAGVTTITEVG